MLSGAVVRLVDEWAIRPGARAVVGAADDDALAAADTLARAGVGLAARIDLREGQPRRLAALGRRGRLQAVEIDGRRHDCDLLVASGGRQPAYSLLAQAGARVEYDAAR